MDSTRKRSKIVGVIFKVDFEKAYDRVDWSFVDYMLRRFGLGDTWRGWMRECILTTSFFVLVNGSPSTQSSEKASSLFSMHFNIIIIILNIK